MWAKEKVQIEVLLWYSVLLGRGWGGGGCWGGWVKVKLMGAKGFLLAFGGGGGNFI